MPINIKRVAKLAKGNLLSNVLSFFDAITSTINSSTKNTQSYYTESFHQSCDENTRYNLRKKLDTNNPFSPTFPILA